uniref:labd-13Z-ene-9,15,16-triol synthase, chloroplastic-like n=1 Tax=Erigeron canadensis TaxID=72917 RepID=UPI001CB94BCE|nr:labd-13Z-ene-9,15,16-triol synthase, chloroplastic-like [Erigeron canadensis]
MSRLITSQWSWLWEVMSSYEITLAFVTISVVALAINLWYKATLSNSSPPLPPGPLSLPVVGYLPFLGPELHKQLTHMAHTYGPIFKFHLGSKLHVVINTPELAKEVLRDQDETFSNRDLTIASSIISYGGRDIVMSENNSDWRKLRKIFVHEILSNKNLEACRSLRTDEVRKTIKHVFSNIGTSINISKIAFLTQANVITNMIWDNKSNKGEKGSDLGDELQIVASNIVEFFGKPNLSDFFPSLAWFDFQGIERGMKKQLDKLDQILTSIIEDRVKSNLERSEDKVGHEGKKDFLQMLLDLKDRKDASSLNITQIKALLLDIMVAGTETTSTLTEWTLTEIMKSRNVMKKVQEELAEVVGANNIVEESHLSRLQYLDATIKETFRLHPVLPFLIPHLPSQDCTVGGYSIPNGCSVFLNVWSIHRDPRYWNNPLEFNPERFLTNKFDYKGKDLKFFPFGSGRRICAGIPVAEKMQVFILASLMHSFDWRLPEGEEHDLTEISGITLRKRNRLMVIPSQRLHDKSLYN